MTFFTMDLGRGGKVTYGLQKPKTIDSTKILLFLPPGDQSREMVEEGLEPWLDNLKKKWMVISPQAPKGRLYFRGSEKIIAKFIDQIFLENHLDPIPIPLLGVSNGGISAFRVATLFPEKFSSITVAPGWPKPVDEKRIGKMTGIPVSLVVGSEDKNWLSKAEWTKEVIESNGGNVSLKVIRGGDHYAFKKLPFRSLERMLLKQM